MNIGTFYAIDRDRAEDYVTEGFRQGYVLGSDLNDDAVLSALARAMDWPVEEFLSYLESSDGQERYEACNVNAEGSGIAATGSTPNALNVKMLIADALGG